MARAASIGSDQIGGTALVTIVGVGALGSHVVQFLRNEKISLRVIDFDRVEQRNALSQFHARGHAGKLKVEALKQTMNFLWGRWINVIPYRLDVNNVAQLLEGSRLVIDCLDNGSSRRLIQAWVRMQGRHGEAVPCLHGALAAEGEGFGRVIWTENFVVDDEDGTQPTCEAGAQLPFIALVAAYLARVAQTFLATGRKDNYVISPGGAFLL